MVQPVSAIVTAESAVASGVPPPAGSTSTVARYPPPSAPGAVNTTPTSAVTCPEPTATAVGSGVLTSGPVTLTHTGPGRGPSMLTRTSCRGVAVDPTNSSVSWT